MVTAQERDFKTLAWESIIEGQEDLARAPRMATSRANLKLEKEVEA